jgi:hypothetical protein
MHASFDNVDYWNKDTLDWHQQGNIAGISANASTPGFNFGTGNELRNNSMIENLQNDTILQKFQATQAPCTSDIAPTLQKEDSANTEASSSISSNSSLVVTTTQKPHLSPILGREDSTNAEVSSSTSSNSSWVIPTPPSEKDITYDSGSSSGSQKISMVSSDPSLSTPTRYEWTLPKRVS